MRPLQLTQDAPWKQRFRIPIISTYIARMNPARGLVASNQSGVFQLYAWDVASNALTQLTHVVKGKPSGVIASDGDFVYYLLDQDGNELGHWVRVPFAGGSIEDLTPDLPAYASWLLSIATNGSRATIVTADDTGYHLLALNLGPSGQLGSPQLLFETPKLVAGLAVAADGTSCAITLNEHSNLPQFTLAVIDALTGKRIAELWDGPETSISITGFSPIPGDTRLLGVSDRSGDKRPFVWDTATGDRRNLLLDDLVGEVEAWDWWPDGSAILLCHVHAAVQQLYRYDLTTDQLQPLAHPSGTFVDGYTTQNQDVIVHWNNATNPQQAISLDYVSGTIRQLPGFTGVVPISRPWRSVTFPTQDGSMIQGWLATPDGDGPFPTILETHGGPTSVTMESFSPGTQMWLDHGFAFLTINYHGSTTFGKAFEESIYGQLGHHEVNDLAAAHDFLVREGIAQPDAILLTGWSYGGYLTLMGLGLRPELWAGGMAGIAIADWAIQYEDTAATLRGYQEAILGGTPEQKPDVYAKSSPITYAEHVRVPVLVIQGRNDTRCPARPMQLYQAKLQSLGKHIEIEWFEAGHGSYEVDQEIDHHELMLRYAYRMLG